MNKRILFLLSMVLLAGIGFICCEQDTCPELVDSDYALQFVLRGGFAGVNQKLVLDEVGTIETYNSAYLVTDSISSEVREVWRHRLNDVGFFCLDDYYPPAEIIMDGFSYELTVSSRGKTKTVSAEDRGGHPAALRELFWDLHYDLYLPIYQDSAKVGTLLIWQEYGVLPWPFAEQAPLADNIYTEYFFSVIDTTGAIALYLNGLYYPDSGYNKDINYLHLEGDYLYRLTMIENGFKVNSAHPVRYWPLELNISLSEIPDEGLVIRNDIFRQVAALFIEPVYVNSIFVMSLATEVVSAYHLRLINGEVVD
ncbi:MAG: hypothetical protein ACETWG_09980 [Candidatus Neomarinimicrobiota bacterium]